MKTYRNTKKPEEIWYILVKGARPYGEDGCVWNKKKSVSEARDQELY
jgi:hypothetical protein